jgi:hypothetical protein
MADLPKDPSNHELLDRLVKVEGKLISRIMKLETENVRLQAMLDDLTKGWKASLDTNLHQFATIYDLLWPVVEKVFPQFRRMQDKVHEIVPPSAAHPTIDWRPGDYKRDQPLG